MDHTIDAIILKQLNKHIQNSKSDIHLKLPNVSKNRDFVTTNIPTIFLPVQRLNINNPVTGINYDKFSEHLIDSFLKRKHNFKLTSMKNNFDNIGKVYEKEFSKEINQKFLSHNLTLFSIKTAQINYPLEKKIDSAKLMKQNEFNSYKRKSRLLCSLI